MVFVALGVLTAITVGISYAGFGAKLSEFLAFTIASLKALIVAMLFMHLRWEPRTIIIFAIAPVVLAIIFMLAISPDIGIAG
jgi:cytochrome c oxidase subunit 4